VCVGIDTNQYPTPPDAVSDDRTDVADTAARSPPAAHTTRGQGNHRNGSSAKTVHTGVGSVQSAVPRDRANNFTPQIVPKNARRVEGFDEAIIALYAMGLTIGEMTTWPNYATAVSSTCSSWPATDAGLPARSPRSG